MWNTLKELIDGSKSILTGYRITITEFFRKPVTLQYPWEKDALPPRFRGKLAIKGFFDEKGIEEKSTLYPGTEQAPCMKTCPALTDVRGYITAVAENNFEQGIRILKNTYPFAASLGRVCPAPCEGRCSQETVHGAPLTIRYLKRFLTDFDRQRPVAERITCDMVAGPVKDARVAVIGAGPAGLTCAWELARRGYGVTVYEKLGVAGGYLVTGIPVYRLPREILKEEIDSIIELGVELKLNSAMGRDFQLEDLFQDGYKAVFLGLGATKPASIRCDGESLPGVIPGEDFLEKVNLGETCELGKKVVVVGGGNTAIDCARVARRLGADVTIIYRRTIVEMPADQHEIKDCMDEGVEMRFLTAPSRIEGNDRVTGIECLNCCLGEPDESGRCAPVPIACSEFVCDCDTVISAVSRKPDLTGVPEGIRKTRWGTIEVDPQTGATSMKDVYAGGDLTLGAATVIEAIACAKRSAEAIDRALSAKDTHHNLGSENTEHRSQNTEGGKRST